MDGADIVTWGEKVEFLGENPRDGRSWKWVTGVRVCERELSMKIYVMDHKPSQNATQISRAKGDHFGIQ